MLRSTGFFDVFPGEGAVILGLDDAQFHARRALYSFVNFPAVLEFDWFLAYPDGAPAPVPPLFDWATAAVARLLGDETNTFERVAAWVSPVLGALLAWPAFAIARCVASTRHGLVAAWLVAVLPSGILVTSLGNFDHHGAVALVAACWLASSLTAAGRSGRKLALWACLHACVVTLMLFTWSGSLLYVALGAGAQLSAIVLLHGRPERLAALGASLLGAALPASAWLLGSRAPLGGAFSSQCLSWLHVIALLGIATPVLALAAWERARSSTGPRTRILRLMLLGGALALPWLALPTIREEVLRGILFLAQQDEWAATNPEQLPLFHSRPELGARLAIMRLGFFAYLVPILPLFLAWRVVRSREREKLVVLLLWVSALCALLLSQVRYGTDFSVPGAVAFALMLGDAQRWLGRRLPAPMPATIVTLVALVGLSPFMRGIHYARLVHTVSQWEKRETSSHVRRLTPHEEAIRFGELVRAVTPETSGFLEPGGRPEYGILVPPHIGHRFTYTARRPVPANNLGPYLDRSQYRLAKTFYAAIDGRGAIAAVDALGVRYVVTTARRSRVETFAAHLHLRNGSRQTGHPAAGRLRLVAMAAREPVVSGPTTAGPGKWRVPYKLFEVVAGAVLVAEAEPGSPVRAAIRVIPQEGEAFSYGTLAHADPDGLARLRVPYASGSAGRIRTSGPWVVRTAERILKLSVSEEDVREGREVRTSPRAPGQLSPSIDRL